MSSKAPKQPKPRGRPPRRKKKAEDQAPPPTAATPGPEPPSPTIIPTARDPSQGIPLLGDDARHAMLAAQSAARAPTLATSGVAHRLFLNALPHNAEAGWKLAARMPTEDLAAWFDDQLNDFHSHTMSPKQDVPPSTLAVVVKWIGHPGTTPRDPRARRCFICWNDPPPPQALIDAAIAKRQPVVRWELVCAGIHELDLSKPPEDGGEDDNSALEDEEVDDPPLEATAESVVSTDVAKCSDCACNSKAEVYADDLSTVSVWQQNEHPDVPLEDRARGLQFSRLQHSLFLERLRLHGIKVSSLVIESQRLSHTALGRTTPLPLWREAKPKELTRGNCWIETLGVRPIFLSEPTGRRRFGKFPLFSSVHEALSFLQESKFTIGLTDDYSLDSGIAYTRKGVLGSDQCWRNKSQNRAALSLLCTVDEGEHMVPVALFISANAKTETLLEFFSGTYQKIVDRAKVIVEDPSVITTRNRTDEVLHDILVNAQDIVINGWQILQAMIDMHYPSLLAIRAFCWKYNLTIRIRLCQFHVVQAILNWQWGDGRKGLAVVISKPIKFRILWLFRMLQRARTREEFDALVPKFQERVRALIMEEEDDEDDDEDMEESGSQAPKGGKSRRRGKTKSRDVRLAMADAVAEYFEGTWFVEDWIACPLTTSAPETYTDIGLPPNQGRDGIWNTNNWSESAFKTFDTVFLQSRQNKRIDRLSSHILNDFLPYYQYWRPRDRRPPQEMIDMHDRAYALWDSGCVAQLEPNLYGVDVMEDGIPVRFEVTMNPMRCKCINYQQAGKVCLHALTVRLFISNGPVENWQSVEKVSEEQPLAKDPDGIKRKKVRDDDTESAEIYDILGQLKDAEAKERDHEASASPEPPFAPVQPTGGSDPPESFGAMGKTPGRPSNSTPVRPGAAHEPKFSRKTGPPKVGRLGPSSLFSSAIKDSVASRRRTERLDSDGELSPDEIEMIGTANVTRWSRSNYEKRAEEMDQWANLLNHSEIAQRDGWLFVACSPTCFPPDVMRALDWSVPVDPDNDLNFPQLRAQRLEILADVFAARGDVRLNHLVCLHLHAHHWTNFHHNLTSREPIVERLNPLGKLTRIPNPTDEVEVGFNIADQVLLALYLHPNRMEALRTGTASGKPRRLSKTFQPIYLNLQLSDTTTCGFWCVFVAFAKLLDLELDQQLVWDMDKTPADLKNLLGPIYSAFRADELGVPVELVRQQFHTFQPGFDYTTLTQSRFSIRPVDIARVPVTEANLSNPFSANLQLQHLVDPSLGNGITWLIGSHRPSADNLRDLRDGKEMHNVILDAYLDLFVQDLEESKAAHPRFMLVDSLDARDMQTATRNASNMEGMAPKSSAKKSRKYWFEKEDIFQLDWLIIPWFWSRHWMLVSVEFKGAHIYVYDSYKSDGGKARGNAVTQRTLQMLRWEHRARYQNRDLGKEWTNKLSLLEVPQQGNTVLCGLYTIWFATQVASGNTQVALWSFGPRDCDEERDRVLNRLCAAVHADTQERNVEQLARLGVVLPDPADARHLQIAQLIYPELASTDKSCMVNLNDWRNLRHKRLNVPTIGSCFFLYNSNTAILYPAIIRDLTDGEFTLEWFGGIYEDFPDVAGGWIPRLGDDVIDRTKGFCFYESDLAQPGWKLLTEMLARIQWPAHLVPAPIFFPSPFFSHQQALADALRQALPEIASLYLRHERRETSWTLLRFPEEHPETGFEYIDACFRRSSNPQEFYKEFLGTAPGQEPFCAADEEFFTSLRMEIWELIPPDEEAMHVALEDYGRKKAAWLSGPARCMLAATAASVYLGRDIWQVIRLLEGRRIYRPPGQHEIVLEAYTHALRNESLLSAELTLEDLLVVTPGIAIPFPCTR
ncbi:hypothetical protein DFH06DRAFT_1151589 [Mycena polygramma]|nr:hypothetical protein DFH06DRAFT_1151589 [Mycena polygramma]